MKTAEQLDLVTSSIAHPAELTERERSEMYALLDLHFEGVTSPQFERDLSEKNAVIRLWRGGSLVGFSTLLSLVYQSGREKFLILHSGDTIVDPSAWNSTGLARAWIQAVNRIRKREAALRCFWLLLSSGFRTYRILPVFWREFYPRYDCETPADRGAFIDDLAVQRYGDAYERARGIVRFPHPQKLRSHLREVVPGRVENPHVKFFLERNPYWENGDELVCVTEISESNLTRAGERMVRNSG